MRSCAPILRKTHFTSFRISVSAIYARRLPERRLASQRTAGERPALLYADLARSADQAATISGPGSKKEVVEVLRKFFVAARQGHADDLKVAVKLLLCQPRPANAGFKLGVGRSTLLKAVANVFNEDAKELKHRVKADGDLGTLAGHLAELRGHVGEELTVNEVLDCMMKIGSVSGKGANGKREEMIGELLRRASPRAMVYLVRMLLGKGLRIGAGEATVFQALAACMRPHGGGATSGEVLSRRALVQPDIDHMIDELSSGADLATAAEGSVCLGTPVRPMLATPIKGFGEVETKISRDQQWSGQWTAEWKYDGIRLQIHVCLAGTATCNLFSRALKNISPTFPDVIECVLGSLKDDVRSGVFDAEVVAIDPENGEILPFQSLMKRKKVADLSDITPSVQVFIFDCLHLNGKDLLSEDFSQRRLALQAALRPDGGLRCVEHRRLDSIGDLEAAFHEAVAARTEGLVVKSLATPYHPAARSASWLKLKKDFVRSDDGRLADTIDAVVVGVRRGQGKRSGVFGSFLVAVRGHAVGSLQSLCWIGTGLSDAELADLGASLKVHDEPPEGLQVLASKCARPDGWIHGGPVWEVQGADITRSPAHACAQDLLVGSGGGLSLRFPRVLRARASIDKDAAAATSAREVLDMYHAATGARP